MLLVLYINDLPRDWPGIVTAPNRCAGRLRSAGVPVVEFEVRDRWVVFPACGFGDSCVSTRVLR